MRYPYDNYTITCLYKKRGKMWSLGYHTGTDFVGEEKQVKAICDGLVRVVAFDKKGYGNYISIQSNDGKRILYCHLEVANVCIGQQVKEGDVIGIEGSTGNSTGSHLHLEIRVSPYTSKSTIDPIEYIEKGIGRMFSYKKEGSIHVIKVPVNKFQIIEWNKGKRTTKIKNYCNAGFFASGKTTTEPMGNLVIKNQIKSETCNSYGNLAGHKLHTLCIDNDNNISIIETDKMSSDYKYAISGLPVTLNGEDVSWSQVVKPQGWNGDELRPTKHICISHDEENIIIFGITTTRKTPAGAITEIWKKLKPYGLSNILLLDGGGSTVIDVNGTNVFVTDGNRKVNNFITFS